MTTAKRFVKAAATAVSVARSQAELERILRRYGASGFGTTSDYEKHLVRVSFRVPDSADSVTAAAHIPVRFDIDVHAVAVAIYGEDEIKKTTTRWQRSAGGYGGGRQVKKGPEEKYQQAERCAWRLLVDWVDAACSAASANLQPMSEAFLANTLVKSDKGQVVRMVELMDTHGGGSWRGLLTPGDNR